MEPLIEESIWIDPNVSSRRQAAMRLEGMNFCKQMDLQDDGYIHPLVLARTLHIFDKNVFTQDFIKEIVEELEADGRPDGKVPLIALAEYLAQITRAPSTARTNRSSGIPSGSRTPSKTDMINASVEAYTNHLVSDIRGFHEVVNSEALVDAAGSSPEEIAELRAQLKAHAKLFVIDAQLKIIRPLWDLFDRDGCGVLEPCECTGLVAAYLHAMARQSSDIIRGSIELGIELSLIISLKEVKDETTREQMRTHARLQIEAIHANVAPLVQTLLDKMASEDPHTIAGELLQSLDLVDGKVTRNEFEQRFVESMQYVLGPEGLMDKLQAKNSLR